MRDTGARLKKKKTFTTTLDNFIAWNEFPVFFFFQ